MSDTARRLAEEKYPDLPDREFVGDGDQSTTRAAFLAGWDAAIEHAAQVAETHEFDSTEASEWVRNGGSSEYVSGFDQAVSSIAAAIRAERSDR